MKRERGCAALVKGVGLRLTLDPGVRERVPLACCLFVTSSFASTGQRSGPVVATVHRGHFSRIEQCRQTLVYAAQSSRASAWFGSLEPLRVSHNVSSHLREHKQKGSSSERALSRTVMAAVAAERPSWRRLANWFVDGFPVWCALASYLALKHPQMFVAMPFVTSPQGVSLGLSLIMLSMGLTLTWYDVARCLGIQHLPAGSRASTGTLATSSMVRRAVILNTMMCFVVMPLVAYLLATTIMTSPVVVSSLLGASPGAGKTASAGLASASKALKSSIITGMVLLGSVSGGQASNLCTYIAKGDVGMSVTMTTATTLLVTVALPLITSLLLGAAVPVEAARLALSTARVVLLPLALGVMLNTFVLRTNDVRARLAPWLPVLGVTATLFTIVGALPPIAATVLSALGEIPLVLAVVGFHVLGGFLGYRVAKVTPGLYGDEAAARTISIETMFKSPALSFILAAKHFDGSWVLVPSAISLVVLAPLAAAYAVLLRRSQNLSLPTLVAGAASLTPFKNAGQPSFGSSGTSRKPTIRSDALSVGQTRVKTQPATASPMVAAPPRLLHPRVRVYFRNAPNPVTVSKSELRSFLLKMRKMKGMQVVKIVEI
jgi:BASS family bile acid:Na+ symporter